MRNLANVPQNHFKVPKLVLSWDPFVQSTKCIRQKFTEEPCVMTLKNVEKSEEELACRFKIDKRNLTNFDSSTWVSKICSLMGCFWPRYIMSELKKYRRVIFQDTREWCNVWRKTDLCFGKWQEEFSKISPEHTKVSNFGLLLDLFSSKVENVWA